MCKNSKAWGRADHLREVKEINPVRQIGRWPDDQWELIRAAGALQGRICGGVGECRCLLRSRKTRK